MRRLLSALAWPFMFVFSIGWLFYKWRRATIGIRLTHEECNELIDALHFNGGAESWVLERRLIEMRNDRWAP